MYGQDADDARRARGTGRAQAAPDPRSADQAPPPGRRAGRADRAEPARHVQALAPPARGRAGAGARRRAASRLRAAAGSVARARCLACTVSPPVGGEPGPPRARARRGGLIMTSDLGTLHAVGDRMMLRFERRMTHPVDRVWRMITEPQGLARWFPARTEYDSFEVGARITFTFEPQDIERARDAGVEEVPLVSTGAIRLIEPPRVFEFDWAGELVRFELST